MLLCSFIASCRIRQSLTQMPEGSGNRILRAFLRGSVVNIRLQLGKLDPVMSRLDCAVGSLRCAGCVNMIDFIDLHRRTERRYIRFSAFVCTFFLRFHRVCLAFFAAADVFLCRSLIFCASAGKYVDFFRLDW